MFSSYADTIIIPRGEVAGPGFRAAVAEHLASPAGPVRVVGGPRTGKLDALGDEALVAGLHPFVVLSATPGPDVRADMLSSLSVSESDVVLIVAADDLPPAASAGDLHVLAAHPKVRNVFVVDLPDQL
jgi:hypothetical protein